MNQYKSLGYQGGVAGSLAVASSGKSGAIMGYSHAQRALDNVAALAQRASRQHSARHSLALGQKANKFQKHYREQIL